MPNGLLSGLPEPRIDQQEAYVAGLLEAGVAVKLDEIRDDWLREALAQWARKRWGSRVAR